MKLTEFFSDQLDREIPISRRVLGRVPEGRPDWKPHEKSMALSYLATLSATNAPIAITASAAGGRSWGERRLDGT